MKVYFDVHGALTVEGEDATEWLAIRTWAARWSDNAGPLVVKWKTERMMQRPGDEKPWPTIETDSRQLFRAMSETPNAKLSGLEQRRASADCDRSRSNDGLERSGGKGEA